MYKEMESLNPDRNLLECPLPVEASAISQSTRVNQDSKEFQKDFWSFLGFLFIFYFFKQLWLPGAYSKMH